MDATLDRESTRELLDRWAEAWASRDAERLLALVTDDVTWYDPSLPETACGKAAARDYLVDTFRAFPDLTVATPEEPYYSAEAPRCALPWIISGTFEGPLEGPGFAPTGKRFEIGGVDVYELRGELFCRIVSRYDTSDMLRQLGVLPERGGRAERIMARLQRLSARRSRRR
jgi:steroid delta-isomerase-like uncharacterized protein